MFDFWNSWKKTKSYRLKFKIVMATNTSPGVDLGSEHRTPVVDLGSKLRMSIQNI